MSRNSTDAGRVQVSHGRGGAGNMSNPASPQVGPVDLSTPTIKSKMYTTGRGGAGNMAENDAQRPEIARETQDVEAPPARIGGEEQVQRIGRGEITF